MKSISRLLTITYLEMKRSLLQRNIQQWFIYFSITLQLFLGYTLVIGIGLGNFLNEERLVKIHLNSILYGLIIILPAFTIFLAYSGFIQDELLPIFVIGESDNNRLYFGKCLSIHHLTYVYYLINSTIAFGIVLMMYPRISTLYFYLRSLMVFYFVSMFYALSVVTLTLLVRRFTKDPIGPLFLPILLFFIIPLLINSSLSFEVFNPIFLRISPTIWLYEFALDLIFHVQLNNYITPILLLTVISTVLGRFLFDHLDFL